MSQNDIIFEQPVNERVRTMLRLEHLFSKLAHHRQDSSAWGLRASVDALIDILSLFSRNDLKTEITRELNEKYQALAPLRERPGVNTKLLDDTLRKLEATCASIQDQSSQAISQTLKDSDFLLAVINRSAIPGGTGHIDMPSYHRWLSNPDGRNRKDLEHWLSLLVNFERASALYLDMLRQSAGWQEVQAEDGMFVHSPQEPFHLVRIALPASSNLYPEISAGRQRFSIRLLQQSSALEREQALSSPNRFRISLCSL